jgi:antitoxin (DNA-binding transcriptional repressor) of toxin-antitoxin stability system
MKRVSVSYARKHLRGLVVAAEAGVDVVITRGGREVARLEAIRPAARRRFGTLPGFATVGDDFDAPLSIDALDPTRR